MKPVITLILAVAPLTAQAIEPPNGLTERHLMAVLIAQRNFYAAIYESQMACSKAGKDFNLDALGCVERTVPPESPQPPPQPQRLRKPLIEPAPPK